MRGMRAFIVLIVLQIACALSANLAQAENRALMIGASTYPTPVPPLHGPRNDIQTVWSILTQRGFKKANIHVLADALPEAFAKEAAVDCKDASGPSCPRYAAIIRALGELAAGARRGDFVVLYFSGHGVQIPDLIKRDKPDGLREAFVPLDVGLWQEQRQTVENLLTSDLIGDAIEKMRSKGAFVWALFDTCHSGDMVRGATDAAQPRNIRAQILGIPDAAFKLAREGKPLAEARKKRSSLGLGHADGLVGFYAAQSDQLALELPFREANAEPLVMGAFTNALRRALAREPNPSYRRLAQSIVNIYAGLGADMPAPFFEGDLDKAIFSDKAPDPVWNVRWAGDKLLLEAGELDGLAEGAIVALIDSPAADAPAAGYARVEHAFTTRSEIAPISYADKGAPAGASFAGARLEQPGIGSVLRVGLPPEPDRAANAGRAAMAAIDELVATAPERRPFAIEWVGAEQPANLHLRVADGRIWLLSEFGEWRRKGARQSLSIEVTEREATAKVLQDNLWRAARALNLQRVAGGYGQTLKGEDTEAAKSLQVELFLYRDPRAAADERACPKEPAAQGALPAGALPIATGFVPEFRHCDIVYVIMRNGGEKPIDVTLLYVDADAQIQCFSAWGKARIEPKEVRDRLQAFRIVTMDPRSGAPLPIGRERLMVIGVEKAKRDSIETSFCHLAQPSLDRARSQTRRGGGDAFEALMEEAGLATTSTRGLGRIPREELGSVALQTFTWDVKDETNPQ